MLFGLLTAIFAFVCVLLVLIILIQKGSSSMGLGNVGGRNVMLFGGSGGQDFLQKTTWVLGTLFMAGSLVLALLKTHEARNTRYVGKYQASAPITTEPVAPAQAEAPAAETK